MTIQTFCDSSYNSITYLIINNNKAIVIDPSNNIKTLKKFLDGTTLEAVLVTHGHYDHFKEIENLLDNYDVPVYLHKKALEKMNDPKQNGSLLFGIYCGIDITNKKIHFVNDSEKLKLIDLDIKVLFTPGHTSCSVSYLIEKSLFSGDLIFYDGIGRYDLPTASYPALIASIDRIKHLDKDIIIYSGHDESFTLEDGMKFNKYLKN